jgi:type IV secretory pathway VirB6-like protein
MLASCGEMADCVPADHVKELRRLDMAHNLIINMIFGNTMDALYGKKIQTTSFLGVESFDSSSIVGKRDWKTSLVYSVYSGITSNAYYRATYYLCVVLLIISVGIMYLFGLKAITIDHVFKIVIQITLIALFTNPSAPNDGDYATGWQVFNRYIAEPIMYGIEYTNRLIVASMYGVPVEKVSAFAPMDMVIGVIFNGKTLLKIIALLFSGGIAYGLSMFIVTIFAFATLLLSLMQAMMLYVTILILLGLLIAVAPIFLILMLFERTEAMYQKWYKQILSFGIQQYMLFTALFIFCEIATDLISNLLFFETCWRPIIELKLKIPFPKELIDLIEEAINFLATLVGMDGDDILDLPDNILDIRIPIFLFFTGIFSYAFPAPGIFVAATLYFASIIFSKFLEKVTEFGASFVEGSAAAGSFNPYGGMVKEAQAALLSKTNAALGNAAGRGLSTRSIIPTLSKGKDGKDLPMWKKVINAPLSLLNMLIDPVAKLWDYIKKKTGMDDDSLKKKADRIETTVKNRELINTNFSKIEESAAKNLQNQGIANPTKEQYESAINSSVRTFLNEHAYTGKSDNGKAIIGLQKLEAQQANSIFNDVKNASIKSITGRILGAASPDLPDKLEGYANKTGHNTKSRRFIADLTDKSFERFSSKK